MTLSVKNLRFGYRRLEVLRGVTFSVGAGAFLAVLGPNGVGKSTLFRCILGLLPGYSGAIEVDGVDMRSLSPRELARRVAYIPQVYTPAFGYSALDTVLMGVARHLPTFAQPSRAQAAEALDALEKMGVAHLAARNFACLSGGERQLVLVARAIVQQADILIMDEPTSNLDFGNQLRVLEHARALAESGYTVLMSTHNPQHALSYASRVLALQGGKVAAWGTPKDALTPDLMRRLYGIDVCIARTQAGPVIAPITREGRENCV